MPSPAAQKGGNGFRYIQAILVLCWVMLFAGIVGLVLKYHDDWKSYHYPENFVSIEFPHDPTITDRTFTFPNSAVTVHDVVYQALDGADTLYQMGVAKYSNTASDKQRIQGALAALASTMSPQSISTSSLMMGTHHGVLMHGTNQDPVRDVTIELFVVQNRVYQIVVMCQLESCNATSSHRFLNSVQFDN